MKYFTDHILKYKMTIPTSKLIEVSERDILACPNVKVCGNYVHKDSLKCCDCRCWNCDILLGEWQEGNLEFKHINKCSICYKENLEGIAINKYQHFVCVGCFKNIYQLNSEPFLPPELFDYAHYLNSIENEFPNETYRRHFKILSERYPEMSEIIINYSDICHRFYNRNNLTYYSEVRCPTCTKQ